MYTFAKVTHVLTRIKKLKSFQLTYFEIAKSSSSTFCISTMFSLTTSRSIGFHIKFGHVKDLLIQLTDQQLQLNRARTLQIS